MIIDGEPNLVLTVDPPVTARRTQCRLPGCDAPIHVDEDGKRHDYCSWGHREAHLRRKSCDVQSPEKCAMPGCDRGVWVEPAPYVHKTWGVATSARGWSRWSARSLERSKAAIRGAQRTRL